MVALVEEMEPTSAIPRARVPWSNRYPAEFPKRFGIGGLGPSDVIGTERPMRDQVYYNFVASVLALGVVVAGGLTLAAAPPSPLGSARAGGTSHLNLSIVVNPTNGWPQFSPANFSVSPGKVIVTITDEDSAMAWTACTCTVSGTVGGTESINGTPAVNVNDANVAHTFTVPTLGINVLSPGQSVVSFTLDLSTPGTYVWICEAPCGQGTDGYTSPPMGLAGYMTGSMTVV